ncbi:MAG: cation:proton antiporter [Burkholderiaceae bacterium]|nr:cation:proton antiporter [Burkholderiaceae bacterium]
MSSLPLWLAIPVALLLVSAGLITLIGSAGLLRLPDFYARMHAPTMGNTLGAFCVLLASIIVASFVEQRPILHPILITVLLIITAPCTAILLMRAAIKRQARAAQLAAEQANTTEMGPE